MVSGRLGSPLLILRGHSSLLVFSGEKLPMSWHPLRPKIPSLIFDYKNDKNKGCFQSLESTSVTFLFFGKYGEYSYKIPALVVPCLLGHKGHFHTFCTPTLAGGFQPIQGFPRRMLHAVGPYCFIGQALGLLGDQASFSNDP